MASVQVPPTPDPDANLGLDGLNESTRKQYRLRQEEWKEFCRSMAFHDGDLVTEQKLTLFLNGHLLHRPARRYRHSRDSTCTTTATAATTDETGDPTVHTLGSASIKAYKAAIVHLWRYQQSSGTNSHPHPVGSTVQALIADLARREDERRAAETPRLVSTGVQTGEPDQMWLLEETVPAIAEQLRLFRQEMNAHIERMQKGLQQLQDQQKEINRKLEDLATGRISFSFNVRAVPSADPSVAAAAAPECDFPLSNAVTVPDGSGSSSGENRRDNAEGDRFQIWDPAPTDTGNVPVYRLSRTILTVPDLWREWTTGLGGSPSVESLEALYGARWRSANTERVFYSRRKVIIDAIHSLKRKRGSSDAAVEELELERQRGQLSLNGLSKKLRTAAEP